VARGPHRSALSPAALVHFAEETASKVHMGQAQIIAWDNVNDNPPTEVKISPIAAIPHKLKAFQSILELSFQLRLQQGGVLTRSTKLENVSHASSMHLPKQMMMPRSLWQNGTSRTVSGAWTVQKGRNGILCTSSHKPRGNQPN